MASLNMLDEIQREDQRLSTPEEMLGKGLNQPFNSANSGSRKIMFGTHSEHAMPLYNPERPIIGTGFENRFGDYSSSLLKLDANHTVIAKIAKFSFNPEHHYFLIVKNDDTNQLHVLERVSYHHITESYGFLYDNSEMDKLLVGSTVPKNKVVRKSSAYDEYLNRMDGVNAVTTYLSMDETMEDGFIISDRIAPKFASPLPKRVTIMKNDNDIGLNLYGDDNNYKCIPDIGGESKNGIVCALRREKKEESLYTLAYNRLKKVMMSDDKFTAEGVVVDINIYCNNVEDLENSYYNSQLLTYYNENVRFCNEIIKIVSYYEKEGCKLTYDLDKLYSTCKAVVEQREYVKDKENKPFANTIIDIFIIERNEIDIGDKLANRYGGKGVIAEIRSYHLMPRLDTGEYVDIIYNSSTVNNRLNFGQLFETSLTHIGSRLVKYLGTDAFSLGDITSMILQYIYMASPDQGKYIYNMISNMEQNELEYFIGNIIESTNIDLSIMPMSEGMDIDKLAKIYDEFSWIQQYQVMVPQIDSNGNTRYIYARRTLTCGKEYMYRLKQYAEEKFSVTSLSATNIRNENSRNKLSKNYKSLHTKTPIKFGEMESGDLIHMGVEYVISNLMIHSVSPHARRLTELMLTGDPFEIDIKITEDCSNRNAEILNAYMKTMGLRIVFAKIFKVKKHPISICPMSFYNTQPKEDIQAVSFIDENDKYDMLESVRKYRELERTVPITVYPVTFV